MVVVIVATVLAASAFAAIRDSDEVPDHAPATVLDGVNKRTAVDVCRAFERESRTISGWPEAAQGYERLALLAQTRGASLFAETMTKLSVASARIDDWNNVALSGKGKLPTRSEQDETHRSHFNALVDVDHACVAAGVLMGSVELKDKPPATR